MEPNESEARTTFAMVDSMLEQANAAFFESRSILRPASLTEDELTHLNREISAIDDQLQLLKAKLGTRKIVRPNNPKEKQ